MAMAAPGCGWPEHATPFVRRRVTGREFGVKKRLHASSVVAKPDHRRARPDPIVGLSTDPASHDDGTVIPNACIHLNGEQPVVADLFDMPASNDLGLRCTNIRTLDGKRPVFVDDQFSVFFFSYEHIRFVEIPPASLAENGSKPVPIGSRARGVAHSSAALPPEEDLEIDEDFLRRIREV
jgi:hypothetical protein